MKKALLGILIGFVAAGLLGVGTMLLAQERKPERAAQGPLVVLAGLRLNEGVDAKDAEKLFKENLIPALAGMEGLEMKVLKNMNMQRRGETADSGAYDYIMLAEIKKLQIFMELRRTQDTGLSAFGDMMKKYAGHPYFSLYTVLASTEKANTDDTD